MGDMGRYGGDSGGEDGVGRHSTESVTRLLSTDPKVVIGWGPPKCPPDPKTTVGWGPQSAPVTPNP